MRTTIRRIGAVAASAVVIGAVVAGPAGASSNENYVGSATATGLNLNLLGQKLTFAVTNAKASSALTALAEGAGQLLAPSSTSKASVSGDNTSQQDMNKCGVALPAEIAAVLNIAAACSSATSTVTNGAPHASSESSVAAIDLSANTVLQAIPQLNQTIDQVQAALTPVLGNLDTLTSQLGIKVSDTVGQLVNSLQATKTAAIRLGNSTSDVSTTGSKVASVATAAGAQIDLLPVGGLNLGPLVSIIVGSAKASSVYDRATGVSTPTFDPALVRIRVALPGTGTAQEIPVAPGQSIKLFEGLPLESEIIVGKGSQVTNPDGSVGAIADGVSLRLLKGINSGVSLDLAHAEAGVAGQPAVKDLVEIPRAAELPRTGGNGPWLPIAGVALVLAAAVTRRFVAGTR